MGGVQLDITCSDDVLDFLYREFVFNKLQIAAPLTCMVYGCVHCWVPLGWVSLELLGVAGCCSVLLEIGVAVAVRSAAERHAGWTCLCANACWGRRGVPIPAADQCPYRGAGEVVAGNQRHGRDSGTAADHTLYRRYA